MKKAIENHRSCIFCRSRKNLSREHVIPDWVGKVLPRKTGHHNHVQMTTEPSIVGSTIRSKISNKTSRLGNRQLFRVCEVCNNGWMSRLQELTKPSLTSLILGIWDKVESIDWEALSAWTAMTTCVIAESFGTGGVPYSDREFLRLHKRPPQNWRIWVGRGSNFDELAYSNRLLALADRSTLQLPTRHNSAITTIAIGQVILHAINFSVQSILPDSKEYGNRFGIMPIFPDCADVNAASFLPIIRDLSPEYHSLQSEYFGILVNERYKTSKLF